jgi:hypothetical protein
MWASTRGLHDHGPYDSAGPGRQPQSPYIHPFSPTIGHSTWFDLKGGLNISRDEQTYRIDEELIEWRESAGEVVVLDLRNSLYLGVNRAGAALWHLLARGSTEAEMQQVLIGRWGITEEQAGADVRSFVDWLADAGLLVADSDPEH